MGRPLTQPIYLQLAKRDRWSSTGDLRLVTAGIKKPTTRAPDSVVVKLKVVVPAEAFEPFLAQEVEVALGDIERPIVSPEPVEPTLG